MKDADLYEIRYLDWYVKQDTQGSAFWYVSMTSKAAWGAGHAVSAGCGPAGCGASGKLLPLSGLQLPYG